MNSYILFVYGTFEGHDEIEFFCMEVMSALPSFDSLKYVIESEQNIIVIFESNADIKVLRDEIFEAMNNHTIKFYFLFERDKILFAHIPQEVSDFIFKPSGDNMALKIEYVKLPNELNLDDVLDKIENEGIDSLTPEEKKFLDNFDK